MERIFHVEVTQLVTVRLDAAKFDDAFMREFRADFYDFDTLEDHAKHIAQLQARGVVDATQYGGDFIEGYGVSKEMGIVATVVETDTDIVRVPA